MNTEPISNTILCIVETCIWKNVDSPMWQSLMNCPIDSTRRVMANTCNDINRSTSQSIPRRITLMEAIQDTLDDIK